MRPFPVLCLLLLLTTVVGAEVLNGKGIRVETTTSGVLTLAGLSAGEGGPRLFMAQSDSQPLWTLVLRPQLGDPVRVSPLSHRVRGMVSVSDGRLVMKWAPTKVRGGTVTVSCSFEADSALPLVYGRIKVDNDTDCALQEVQFPHLSLSASPSPPEQVTLVFPRAYGRSWRNPFQAPEGYLVGTQEPYGHWQPEMQFGTLYDDTGNGLYWAAYDGDIRPKRFVIDNPQGTPAIVVKIGQVPPHANRPGADYESLYPIVLGAYTGDWWDAAHLYREWALKQKWCRRGPLERRTDVPQVVKETDLWVRGHGRYGREVQEKYVRQIKEIFGGSVGIQLYDWTENDNWSDPLRWPPREWLVPFLKQAAAEKILVTPYVNSLQWDTKSPSWTAEMQRWALTDWEGKAVEEKATGAQQAVMICASSPLFKQALVDAAVRLVREGGAGGVYLDQLGNQCGMPCYAADHGHAVGTGSYGADGIRDFCEAIRLAIREVNPEAFISGETPPESVIDVVDLRLNHYNVWPGWVNLWAAVYGDQIPSFGRSVFWRGVLGEGDNFYAACGNTFVSGVQFGRIWPTGNPKDFLSAPELAEVRSYFKTVVDLRRAARKFLTYGWLQRPVKILTPLPKLRIMDGKQRPMEIEAVLSSAWASHDGTLGFVFTNISSAPQAFRWQADLSRHEVAPADLHRLTIIKPDGSREPMRELSGRLLQRDETMPAHSALVLEVAPVP